MPQPEPRCARRIGLRHGCYLIAFGCIIFGSYALHIKIKELTQSHETDSYTHANNISDVIICVSAIIASILLLIGLFRNIASLLPFWWCTAAFVNVLSIIQIVLTVNSNQEYFILQLIIEQICETRKWIDFFLRNGFVGNSFWFFCSYDGVFLLCCVSDVSTDKRRSRFGDDLE